MALTFGVIRRVTGTTLFTGTGGRLFSDSTRSLLWSSLLRQHRSLSNSSSSGGDDGNGSCILFQSLPNHLDVACPWMMNTGRPTNRMTTPKCTTGSTRILKMSDMTTHRCHSSTRMNHHRSDGKDAMNHTSSLPILPKIGIRWYPTHTTNHMIFTNHNSNTIRCSSRNSRYYSSSSTSSSGSRNDTNTTQQQPFVPMTPEEEEQEKLRVSQLSPTERDMELRQWNRQIAVLEKKKGINTGELYTWSGKYKALARDYGMPLMVWYWVIWISTGVVCYTTITLFDVDVMYLLQQIDVRTGYHISEQVNPEYGKIGMALVVNEVIEPIRLPVVIITVKPVIDVLYPPKY